jgi:hypothetical protein
MITYAVISVVTYGGVEELDVYPIINGFDNIKEAESAREDYLNTFPQLDPQNIQVLQYKV